VALLFVGIIIWYRRRKHSRINVNVAENSGTYWPGKPELAGNQVAKFALDRHEVLGDPRYPPVELGERGSTPMELDGGFERPELAANARSRLLSDYHR